MKAYNNYQSGKVNCLDNPAALIYAVTTQDCPCPAGTGYNSQTCLCDPCKDHLTGCLLCPSLAMCSQCDTSMNFQLLTGQCACSLGYVHVLANDTCQPVCGDGYVRNPQLCDDGNLINGDGCDSTCVVQSTHICTRPLNTPSVCTPCRTYLSGCQECPNTTACTLCDLNFQLSVETCACSLGYVHVLANDTCQPVCGDGYVRNPQLCDDGNLINGDGCDSTCVVQSTHICTRPLNTPSVCTPCRTYLSGCQECPNTTACTLCDLNFQLSVETCACSLGYVHVLANDTCQPVCGDGYVRNPQLCDDGNLINGDGCDSTCVVQSTHICTRPLNTPSVCTPCRTYLSGCQECPNTTACTLCDLNFQLSVETCACSLGYVHVLANDTCQPVCGDGYVRNPQLCDDGNLINGDGCDNICSVQINYTCTRPLNIPSACSYDQPLNGQLQSILKDPFKNSVTFTIQLSDPNFPQLSTLNFSQLLIPNLPLLNPFYNLSSDGLLTITYDYSQSIEGLNLTMNLSPSAINNTLYWAVPPTVITFSGLTSPNNAPLTFYNQSTYDQQLQFMQVYKWAELVSYVVLLTGMFCDKVIGIELFGVWQTIFFSLSTIDKVQPLLYPIAGLKTVNGINTFMQFQNTMLPERVRTLNVSSQFLGNCNYTVWIAPAVLLLGVVVYFAGRLVKGSRQKVQNAGKRIMCEYFLMVVAFNTLNISYSAGLQLNYKGWMPDLNLALTLAFLAIILATVISICFTPNDADFGEFKLHFKQNSPLRKNFFVVTLFYRTVLGIGMSFLNQIQQATIALFFVGIVFFIYIFSDKPYKAAYHIWRTSIIQLCCLIGLGSAMYYRSMRSTTPISVRTQILLPGYAIIAAILLSILVSLLALGYEFYLKYVHKRCTKTVAQIPEDAVILHTTFDTVMDNIEANNTHIAIENYRQKTGKNEHASQSLARLKLQISIPEIPENN